MLKVNNRNARTGCEIYSKLTTKTPERRQWRRSGVFIVNFEHISRLVLVFLLLTLKMQLPARLLKISELLELSIHVTKILIDRRYQEPLSIHSRFVGMTI